MAVHVWAVEVTRMGHRRLRVFDDETDAGRYFAEVGARHGPDRVVMWEV